MASSKVITAIQRRLVKRLRHGQDGTDGVDGINGVDGSVGAEGPMGPQGPQGVKGDTGPAGPTGPQGIQGVAGSDAVLPRSESLSGTTDANGEVTFNYSAFTSIPHVHLSFIAPNSNTYVRITALTTTSCTIKVEARAGLTLLGLTLLAFAVTNVSGVLVRAKIGL